MARPSTPEPPPRPLTRLFTVEQLAGYLQVPAQTVYYWRTKGAGPTAKYVGRHIRFREDDIAAWLESQDGTAA